MNPSSVFRFARKEASAMALLVARPRRSLSAWSKTPAVSPKKAISEGEGFNLGASRGCAGALACGRWTTTTGPVLARGAVGACSGGSATVLLVSLTGADDGVRSCGVLTGRLARYAPVRTTRTPAPTEARKRG